MNHNISFLHNKPTLSACARRVARRVAGFVIAAAAVLLLSKSDAKAFDDSVYAPTSVLANGKWVKVSVPESGLYMLTRSQLAQWGFNDPERVRVCGYGGARIPDILSQANYVDDLPVAPSVLTSTGNVVFYGVGPEQWNSAVSSRYYRTFNIYTEAGYYFVTEVSGSDDDALSKAEFAESGRPTADNPVDYFWDRLQHERELVSPGAAGPQLVGEDFKYTPQREFAFELKDRADDSDYGVWFETSFVARTTGQASTLNFSVNGASVPQVSTDRVGATTSDIHYYGTEAVTRHTVYDVEGSKMNIRIAHSSPVTVQSAWLNYIAVNYMRKLQLDNNGQLMFWTNSTGLSLGNATSTTRVLDVTTPAAVSRVQTSELTADGRLQWTASFTGWRTYVAFNDDAKLPAPTYVGTVKNQNLHGLAQNEVPDMLIVCPAMMTAQARRIAALHPDLVVQIVDQEDIYNEFSSGMADAGGLRRYFKMLWDKGHAEAPEGYDSRFRYVLLLGRATYDPRMLTSEVQSFISYNIPTWMNANMKQSLNDTDGYGTDDFLTFLKDNSGNEKGLDDLCVALGRIPVRTLADASSYIDKLEQYMTASKRNAWKNSVMFLADDGDTGKHVEQSETFVQNMSQIADNPMLINKVYMDAYVREGGVYPSAREAMFRNLSEGTVWWTFIGHANDHSLTHNDQLTFSDLNNMLYKNIPVFYGATCDFLRWDQNSLSGGEILLKERYGGAISVISATRPVYIYENGLLSSAFGRHLGARDMSGKLLTVGEIYRRSKNNILTNGIKTSNVNRLKYVLMGDPAMPLATPSNIIDITEIGGKSLDNMDSDPVELHAMETTTVKGFVRDTHGNRLTDFNGVVTVTLYDAEYSSTTHGNPDNGTEGKVITFEQQGSRLAAASTSVHNGEFELTITVPVDISDNYRPAAIGTYAYSHDGAVEASGLTNNLYVYGFDENAAIDDTPPTIETMYLNHASFTDGATVDASPMLIAQISDDVSISLSTAGVGHSMTLQLDEGKTYANVAQYYTPSVDNEKGGTISYPFSNLQPGEHTLRLRIWDTSANSTSKTITFTVGERIAPKIYDIYTDASPAHDKANFYLVHDRPDQMATVTVEVYNMLGHPLWSKTVSGVSDMFTSTPVTWDLTDSAGRRVQRGIYLYRATITVDGESYDTGSRRLAVAAQ